VTNLATARRNDQVLAGLTLHRRTGATTKRSARNGAPAVVNGVIAMKVQARPAPRK
jgi:hypothetical protein